MKSLSERVLDAKRLRKNRRQAKLFFCACPLLIALMVAGEWKAIEFWLPDDPILRNWPDPNLAAATSVSDDFAMLKAIYEPDTIKLSFDIDDRRDQLIKFGLYAVFEWEHWPVAKKHRHNKK